MITEKLTGSQVAADLDQRFPQGIVKTDVRQGIVYITVDPAVVKDMVAYLFDQGARFVISVGTDYTPVTGKLEVRHILSRDSDQLTIVVKTQVEPGESLTSIASIMPAANWAEREAHDLVGLDFIGHPDPRRLVMADDWPEGLYPLRRDFPYNYKPPSAPENAVPLKTPEPPASVLPIGPFFPVLEEPAYFRVFVEGETVVGCDYRGFYNHRGIEKLADSALTYNQVPFLAERI